jgi:hydroxymethylbilane synthase
LSVELVEISTTGDQVRDKPLQEFGGRGVFVKELENALLAQRIDLAVHSLKDLPTRQPPGLALGAIVGREDTRDVAAIRGARALEDLLPGSIIGTGSPRRRAQLKAVFPHLEFAEIRGNVETRLRKVREGQYAGAVLARAGLKRLGLLSPEKEELRMLTLPSAIMLPAPGQGALAVECLAANRRVRRVLRAIHNESVSACVSAERAALQSLGGGCHLPLGALAEIKGRTLRLRAALGLPDGSQLLRAESAGLKAQARQLGRKVARALLAQGGEEILEKLAAHQG